MITGAKNVDDICPFEHHVPTCFCFSVFGWGFERIDEVPGWLKSLYNTLVIISQRSCSRIVSYGRYLNTAGLRTDLLLMKDCTVTLFVVQDA